MVSGMAFHAADTHPATSEGAAPKGRLKERCGLEPRTNFFSFFDVFSTVHHSIGLFSQPTLNLIAVLYQSQ